MTESSSEVSEEKFVPVSVQGNPYFHTMSYEIHLPFSFANYTASSEHQASLMHEYTHLIQATSTLQGVFGFIGNTERFSFFFNAIFNRNELKFPIMEWASDPGADEELKKFHSYESGYKVQRFVGEGCWNVPGDEFHELELKQLTKVIAGNTINRWHVGRRRGTEMFAIPILAMALEEAQAECVATYFQGIESTIFAQTGNEQSLEMLFYTSIPAVVQKYLPGFPLYETVFLLTDHALMTFAPDVAFVRGIDFLKGEAVPRTLTEWKDLRDRMARNANLENVSLPNLIEEIDKKIRVFGKHPGNPLTDLFLFGALKKERQFLR